MPDLPTGTVTFVFTDIEGSTQLAAAHPAAWPGILERHRAIVRDAVTEHGGSVVGTEGDSFFLAFPSAIGAVEAVVGAGRALAAETWPEAAEVRVRVGMHSAEATVSDGTYTGLEVHRAARIGAVAHGGQVLLSDAARALVGGGLPADIGLRDLGPQQLREFDEDHVWQLVVPDLQSQFPALRSVAGTPNNLPTKLTSFLGRDHEIAEVSVLLPQARLLTLTGPGGTGKTRLSLEVARRMLDAYPDGVWVVELAAITEPELVTATIAQVLGLPDRGGKSSIERLREHIGSRRVLLVLDNFEQVLAAGGSVTELLGAAPNLTALVTSRSVLHVYGEQEYPVPALALPDPRHLPDLAALSQYEAVALFIARATAVKPDFEVTNANAPAVAEICVRLDGLPLAIELAAARIRVLSPQAMLGRLGDRLALLSGGARDLPARQQTLRGAIAWSHDMLDEADRSLFACMSVFIGGANLEAIERVCGDVMAGDPLNAVESLVDKSLLRQVEGMGGEPRFRMLETIREFAIDQARASGMWDELRRRHAELYLTVADEASGHIMGSSKREWLDRLEEDHDNLRAAIGWAIEAGTAEVALRLIARLWRFWQMRGYLAEGVERATAVLTMPGAGDHPVLLADTLDAAAGLAYWQADTARSRAWYDQEIAQRRALGDRPGLAGALYSQSFTYSYAAGETATDQEEARALISEALGIYEELGDALGMARCKWALANVAWVLEDHEGALDLATDALVTFREQDDRFMIGWTTYTTALYHLRLGGPESLDQAEGRLAESLTIFAEADDVSGYALVLDAFAFLAHIRGDEERAARISGAVANLELITGTGLNLPNRVVLGFNPADLRDDPALAKVWAEGEQMPFGEIVTYALAGAGRQRVG
jgi:predicted ATPase/class 3 adenylate cyclase